jgi:SAM-dependent methyltransferase
LTDIDDELHARIHRAMMDVPPDAIFGPRVEVFARVEAALGVRVGGRVLDVGCGNGYASIWLAQHRDVTEVVALEGSPAAVEELIPRNVAHHGVEDRVTPRLATFDAIGETDAYDFAVAFGALHHSACLYSTFASVARALKPGGFLIAHEPVMPDATTNRRYVDKYDVVEEKYGLSIRNGDRDDHFFRHAEYVVAGAFNQLDLRLDESGDAQRSSLAGRLRAVARGLLKARSSGPAPDRPPRVSDYTEGLEARILVFEKSEVPYVPHRWRALEAAAGP